MATAMHNGLVTLLAGLLLCLHVGCDGRSADVAATAAAAAAPTEGELLLAQAPPGWVESASMATPALRMAEYAPENQSADEIERVTFEAQTGLPLPDPIDFVLAVTADLAKGCSESEQFNIFSGLENGYPTSVRLLVCGALQQSPHGQVVMSKAIKGNEQFYVVTRRRLLAATPQHQAPLSPETMAEWSLYFKTIGLCDTRREDHPCPESLLPQ